jgi:hypothetical protein
MGTMHERQRASCLCRLKTRTDIMSTALRTFEIWQSEGECIATGVCPAGPSGDGCRSMNEPGSELKHVFHAYSELDRMQKYYDYMDFGTYHSEWPDLAVRPFCYVEGLESLLRLKKPLRPMLEISVMGDGSTQPPIPDCLPRIVVQDRAVFAVDVWVRGDYGGHGETPINQAALIKLADALIQAELPELLQRTSSTFLICPLEIAEKMQWPADGRDPAEARKAMA